MTYADRAEELFRQGYNCSQSVFAAFADEINMSAEEAAKNASPFGAGFGKLREVCGAVSGMTMLAGIMRGYSDAADAEGKKLLYRLIQKMGAEFESRQGSIICREMLGLKKGEDLGEPAVRTEEYYRSRPCVKACRDAAEIAGNYLFSGDVVKLLVTYNFPDKEKRDGFYETVTAEKISEISEAEFGCLKYSYELPSDSDKVLLLHEVWCNEDAQKLHMQAAHFAKLGDFKKEFSAETTIERF